MLRVEGRSHSRNPEILNCVEEGSVQMLQHTSDSARGKINVRVASLKLL